MAFAADGWFVVTLVTLVVGVIMAICLEASDCDVLVNPRVEGEVGEGTGKVSVLLVEVVVS